MLLPIDVFQWRMKFQNSHDLKNLLQEKKKEKLRDVFIYPAKITFL